MPIEIVTEARRGLFRRYQVVSTTTPMYWEGSHYGKYDGVGKIDIYHPQWKPERGVLFNAGLSGTVRIKDKSGSHKFNKQDAEISDRIGELSEENPVISISGLKTGRRITFKLVAGDPDHLPIAQTL